MKTCTRRIGIDARFMLRPLRGIPLYVTRLCQYLPELNKDYLFYLFINKGFEHNDKPENYQPRIDELLERHPNIRIVNFDDDAEVMWEQICLPQLIKKHKVDLLHMPANRICFFPGVPAVVTIHDVMEYLCLLDEKYPMSWHKNKSLKMLFYNLRMRAYVIAMYKCGLGRASRVITVSNHSANDLKRHLHIPDHKIHVIYHGVDKEYLNKSPLTIQNRLHTLMLGGDSYQKNPSAAIAAWARVNPDIRKKHPLKIVGFCGNDSSPISEAIKKYGLSNEVEIEGWVNQEEMVEHFRNAVLFLFPSRYEGFGFPLIQAMVSGTPVISTNRSSIPEVLGTVGLQCDPDDQNGMAEGIEQWLSNASTWHEQSEKCKLRAQAFTWENSASNHSNLYRELL